MDDREEDLELTEYFNRPPTSILVHFRWFLQNHLATAGTFFLLTEVKVHFLFSLCIA